MVLSVKFTPERNSAMAFSKGLPMNFTCCSVMPLYCYSKRVNIFATPFHCVQFVIFLLHFTNIFIWFHISLQSKIATNMFLFVAKEEIRIVMSVQFNPFIHTYIQLRSKAFKIYTHSLQMTSLPTRSSLMFSVDQLKSTESIIISTRHVTIQLLSSLCHLSN